jgi:copper(I)-binding protein
MAVGTGTDAAIGAADLTLVRADPAGIADAVQLARATVSVIRANLAWALGYNVTAIPLAAFGYLNPLFAGIAMSVSSLLVTSNSSRLRRFRPRGTGERPVATSGARDWPRDLVRSAAGGWICAVVLVGLLSAWAAVGGAGSISRVRIQVTLAAVPMRGFTAAIADGANTPNTYLTAKNLASTSDELLSVRSPDARRVELTRLPGRKALAGLVIPADGTLTLTPLGDDVVLVDPVAYESKGSILLTPVFRNAGQVTVDATVTAPGTP